VWSVVSRCLEALYVCVCSVVSWCLEALCQLLPRDASMLIHCRWYCHRNQPGGTTGQIEWQQFVTCLLSSMGYSAAAALRPILSNSVRMILFSGNLTVFLNNFTIFSKYFYGCLFNKLRTVLNPLVYRMFE